jgi:SOS-response transcriptional repressor LexA
MTDPAILYLRHVLETKGWTAAELARRAGLAHSTVNRPLTVPDYPNAISRQTIGKVFAASGVDPTPFFGDAGEPLLNIPTPAPQSGVGVPIFDVTASAGDGAALAEQDLVEDHLSFPPHYLREITSTPARHLAIIRTKGDSMVPTIAEDDLVMVDTTKRDLSFDGVFVIRDDGASLLVKRIGRGTRRGHVMVISDNPRYAPTERPLAEIEVLGKVLWMGVKV